MRKIIFRGMAKTVGTEYAQAELLEDTVDDDMLDALAFDISVENAEMYGYTYVEGYDDEDFDDYCTGADLDYYWEEYDPEKHDGLSLCGSFEEEFKIQAAQMGVKL